MSTRKVRIPPLPLDQWGDAEKAAVATFAQSNKQLQPNVQKKDQDLSALALFLNYPDLAKAYLPYSTFILSHGKLSVRDRELLILRVGYLRKSEYEWAQHVLICQGAEIPAKDVKRVPKGPEASGWTAKEKWMLRAADELVETAMISDKTWNGLSKHFDKHQLMEIIFVVGTYDLVAMVFNTLGIPLNDNLRGILADHPLD